MKYLRRSFFNNLDLILVFFLMITGASAGRPCERGIRPDASELVLMDALNLSALIKNRSVSCVEVMEAFLDHIDKYNPMVNAIVALRPREDLLVEARLRDKQLDDGNYLGWMHGFPHAVKDLASAKGLPFTSGSTIYRNRTGTYDEIFVSRIKDAGAIIIGKTNAPEFGLGSQTYNNVYGTTATPYNTSCTSGGSSGGAASALAMRLVPVADGSDYMGSLRNPSAFCNVVGFRPTWGRVPEAGFISQPTVAGPMGRSVSDVARLLSTMAGPYSTAPLSIQEDPEIFAESLKRNFNGTRIAYVGNWNGHLATEPGVLELVESSFGAFESLGCKIDRVTPDVDPEHIWQTFLQWRWLNNLEYAPLYNNPTDKAQLKPEAEWEIERGLNLTALQVSGASKNRTEWFKTVDDFLSTYDYILAPSAQVFSFDKTVHWPSEIDGRKMDTYHRWMETVVPWSLYAGPVAAMPVGFNDKDSSMGVQIIGRSHDDFGVLQLAHAYEQKTNWTKKVLPLALR